MESERVQSVLQKSGMPTVVYYPPPLIRTPLDTDPRAMLRAGDKAADEVLSLPMHPHPGRDVQEAIVAALVEAQ